MSRKSPLAIGTLLFTALLAGCETTPENGILEVTFLGALGGAPLTHALAAIEEGGLNVPIPDPAFGSPAYRYGAQTGKRANEQDMKKEGAFTILLPAGPKGVHLFVDGYYCGAAAISIEPEDGAIQRLEVRANEIQPDEVQRPVASNLRLDPSPVERGATFTLSVDVVAGTSEDPLSDQILVVQPELAFAAALNPPPPPPADEQGVISPDGTWSQTLVAPDAPGPYTYHLVAATQSCVSSAPLTATLVVE